MNVSDAGYEIDTHVLAGLRAVAASWVDAVELKALCTWASRVGDRGSDDITPAEIRRFLLGKDSVRQVRRVHARVACEETNGVMTVIAAAHRQAGTPPAWYPGESHATEPAKRAIFPDAIAQLPEYRCALRAYLQSHRPAQAARTLGMSLQTLDGFLSGSKDPQMPTVWKLYGWYTREGRAYAGDSANTVAVPDSGQMSGWSQPAR